MKLTAIPLLEGESSKPFQVPDPLSPRAFCDLMDAYKALLFPGAFDVESFGHFVANLELEYYPYIGGAAPRTVIPTAAGKDIIFTANESPPDQPIPFHHELAQTPNPPAYVFFYCDIPAEITGGQTPIIDSTSVYRFANDNYPDFIHKLNQEGPDTLVAHYQQKMIHPHLVDGPTRIRGTFPRKVNWRISSVNNRDANGNGNLMVRCVSRRSRSPPFDS